MGIYEYALLILLAAAFLFCAGAASSQPSIPEELIGCSEFIGLVLAKPMVIHLESAWKQCAGVYRIVTVIKGDLKREENGQYPWIYAGSDYPAEYSALFNQKGYCLLFLRKQEIEERKVWATLACYLVQYRPDANGRVVGHTIVEPGKESVLIEPLCANLQKIVDRETDRENESLVRRFLLSGPASGHEANLLSHYWSEGIAHPVNLLSVLSGWPKDIPFDVRFRRAQELAASVRIGMTRAEIELMFPQEDGGISGPGSTRYYLGSEVMVEVPYDQTGGPRMPQNKVNGPLKVYRSHMHYD